MRVLIIGGTRFLGAALARELVNSGDDVTVLHRGQTPGSLPEAVTHQLGDARDPLFVEACLQDGQFDSVVDTIFRAADLTWALPLIQRYAGRLIHCGSTGVYAPSDCVPSREGDPTPCPDELGGFGEKLDQDETLLAYGEAHHFTVCSLRISNVIGPGDVPIDIWGARNPAYFQRLADHQEIWVPNDGLALLQPVHVDDLARGFRAALESDKVAGQIYNLSSDRPVTLFGYARMAAALLNSRSVLRLVPATEILATGKANPGGLRFLCEHMCIDSSKAQRDLDYHPHHDIRSALRETLAWMISCGLLKASLTY